MQIAYGATTKSLFGIDNGYYNNIIDIKDLYTQTSAENCVAIRAAAVCWEKKLKEYNSNQKYDFVFTYASENRAYEASTSALGSGVVAYYQTLYVYTNKSWRKTSQFQIVMTNSENIISTSRKKYGDDWRKTIFIHELGHALSLADLDAGIAGKATGYGNISIMSYNTDFSKVKEPTQLDVVHVLSFK